MQTDATLYKNSLQLDKKNLVEIYQNLNPRLYYYALRLLGDIDLAEECVSETFSRFLNAIKNGGGPKDNIKAYLYRIAHNWITDYYRNQVPEEPLESALNRDLMETPIETVIDNMEQERVRKALLRLTPEQRQVIVLRFYEEWPHEEIASLIGKSAEATRALQHRAFVGLRKWLIEPEETNGEDE